MRGRIEEEPRPANGGERKAKAAQNARAVSREAENLVHKLHAAARDVVEAIDGDLPRELERRYVSGVADIYTQNLHEDRGRRLLDALAETPQGDQLVDASLASESGKLYLLLAQASGRISPQ